MESLIDILSIRREHDSLGESHFVDTYINPLKPKVFFNGRGEVIAYVVDNAQGKSGVLWSCHIDTMHRNGTSTNFMQEVWLAEDGIAFVGDKDDCLGADDGAGVWLMLEMIKADVAGTYIFHRGEEIGCWGSSTMALEYADWLANFTHAIAFDRRDVHSIITHQRGQRACSDALGTKLIELFNLNHELDPTGVYTDTAEYMDIIPECVNVSSGYYSEHSNMETLDTTYIIALRDAICAVDWLAVDLPCERDPKKIEMRQSVHNWTTSWGMSSSKYAEIDTDDVPDVNTLLSSSMRTISDWVAGADPDDVAWLLQDLAEKLEAAEYKLDQVEDVYLRVGLQ